MPSASPVHTDAIATLCPRPDPLHLPLMISLLLLLMYLPQIGLGAAATTPAATPEWVVVTRDALSFVGTSSPTGVDGIRRVDHRIIGAYHLYTLRGHEMLVRAHLDAQDADEVFMSYNHRIEAGPGYEHPGQKESADFGRHFTQSGWSPGHLVRPGDNEDGYRTGFRPGFGRRPRNPAFKSQGATGDPDGYVTATAFCRTVAPGANRGYQPGSPSWALDRCDQRSRVLDGQVCTGFTGKGVHVYVVDTGIQPHSTFRQPVRQDYSFFGFNGVPTGDCNGHGTHVAGLVASEIYGVAVDVQLHAIQVLDCDGSGSIASLAAGLLWIEQRAPAGQPSLINLSLGAQGITSSAIEAILLSLRTARGILAVVAAGNYGDDACLSFPARIPQVFTVAASNNRDARASFSNAGPCVDLFAPGVSVISCDNDGGGGALILSGTSMSTPIVCGAGALLLEENAALTPAQLELLLRQRATQNALSGPSLSPGTPNALLYFGPASAPGDGNGRGGTRDLPSGAARHCGPVFLLSLLLLLLLLFTLRLDL